MSGALLVLALLLPAPARAQGGQPVVLRALSDELERTLARLRLEALDAPHFVAYTVMQTRRLSLESSFGALRDPHEYRDRALRVDLRVGSRELDNAHYAGRDYWSYRPQTGQLPVDDDYDALRFAVWSLTDEAYKAALQRLAQKRAYLQSKLIRERLPDLSVEPAGAPALEPVGDHPFERAAWEKRVRGLSAVFRRFPALQTGAVNLYWTQRHAYFADSEGRRQLRPSHDFELYFEASAQAPDGAPLRDRRRFIRHSLDQMPPYSLLEAEAVRLAESVSSLAAAPALAESYVGPVLLEGQAAGEFFNQLLARHLAAPREVLVEEERAEKEFASGKLTGRLGLRIMSPLLSAEDDPALREFGGIPLIGGYAFDDEGIPGSPVRLVERGILKDLLMSRAPVKERARSNGHGRAAFWEPVTARISNLVLSCERTHTPGELKRMLLERAKEFGLDHAYLARRVDEEDRLEEGQLLAPPVLLYRVRVADGAEEPVRGAEFTAVTLRALRDVAAAGNDRQVYNYYQLGVYGSVGRGQTQAAIVHPSVLVAELELKPTDKKPDTPPQLPRPAFAHK